MEKNSSENTLKSPQMYGLYMSRILRDISECMCLELPIKNCERNLMKNLDEVYSLYTSTKDEGYKEVFADSWKKYDNLLNGKYSKINKLIKLEDINFIKDSKFIHSEEIDGSILIWKKALGIID